MVLIKMVAMNTDTEKPQEEVKPKKRKRNRKWAKRILHVLIILGLMGFAGFVTLRYWIGPNIAQDIATDFIQEYWVGSIEIYDVDLDTENNAIVAEGVSLRDSAGREWVRVKNLRFYFRDWPSVHPVLYGISIESPQVTVFCDDGNINLPVLAKPRQTQTAAGSSTSVQIEWTDIRDIWLELVQTQVANAIDPSPLPELRNMTVKGYSSLRGFVNFQFKPDDVVAAAELTGQFNVQELKVKDLRELLHLPPLKDVTLKPFVMSNISSHTLTYNNGVFATPKFSADVGDGKFVLDNFKVAAVPNEPLEINGDLSLQQVPIEPFYSAFDPTQKVDFGYAFGWLKNIRYVENDLKSLKMQGELFFDNSDLQDVNVISSIHGQMKADTKKLKKGSDLYLLFEIRDGYAYVQKGRMGNNLLAIHVLDGSKANITTQEMDMQVVVAMLDDIRKVPVVGWLIQLNDAVSKLQVSGKWDKPQVKPVLVDKLDKGTKDFFQGIAKAGGEILFPFADKNKKDDKK